VGRDRAVRDHGRGRLAAPEGRTLTVTPGPESTVPADSDDPTGTAPAERVRRAAVTLVALAQDGLEFAPTDYDTDRYRKVQAVATELLSVLTARPAAVLGLELDRESGYATPKVDVRGALVDEAGRLLLMRERTDGRWSLPGGWADPGDRPAEAVAREIREETGYGARATKLVACWDRDARGHVPPLSVGAYKLFFLCEATGEVAAPDELETLEIGWFGIDELPPLSHGRINRHELERVLAHVADPGLPTEFD